jgi:predicted dinucleotide-binding enzyme
MRIATIGRGNIGGGLGKLWRGAGHEVTTLGREGGDVSSADVVLLAAPGRAIAEALDTVTGLEGKTTIDATNLVGTEPPEGFSSNAEYVKSRTGGPTAKSFNINFAAIYDQLGQTSKPPGNLWCGDETAREAVERLNRDAGFDPVYAGPLENAGLQEGFIDLVFAINKAGMGPFFYRIAPPDQL